MCYLYQTHHSPVPTKETHLGATYNAISTSKSYILTLFSYVIFVLHEPGAAIRCAVLTISRLIHGGLIATPALELTLL
jgi:hypothetical protein